MSNGILSKIKAHPFRGIWLLIVAALWELIKHDILSWTDERISESVGTRVVVLPLKIVRWLSGWSVQHPVQLFLLFVGFYVLWVVLRAQGLLPGGRQWTMIDRLGFDYLPDSPLNNGWAIAYPKDGEAAGKWKSAKWSPALPAPIPGSKIGRAA